VVGAAAVRGGEGVYDRAGVREALRMHGVPSVDRAQLDADREHLARLPEDAACLLSVGRVRRYLEALADLVPAREPAASSDTAGRWEGLLREPEALKAAGIRLPPSTLAAAAPFPPPQRLKPWMVRRLARLPSRGTIALIVIGVAVILATSAWGHAVPQQVGEAVIFTLVGARAFGIVVERRIRKRGPGEEVDDDVCEEPGALVGFALIGGTFAAATVVMYEGAELAGIAVSVIGAGLVGLLVALSLALEYGVVSADSLSPMS
jgi:hypothetical protein